MTTLSREFGRHYLIELMDCDRECIKYVPEVREVLMRSAVRSKATMLKEFFHQFDPFGVSGGIFIAESHFSVHTWPEDRYVGVDILTCGVMQPEEAIAELEQGFKAGRKTVQVIPRGF